MFLISKTLLLLLYLSLAVLGFVFVILVNSFQPLYYILWVIMVGGFVFRNQVIISARLQRIPIRPWLKFIGIGVFVILLEEIFATIAMHLARYIATDSFHTFFNDVAQFWMVNLLTLSGLLFAWCVLLHTTQYSNTEVFWLAGIFGLISEKIYLHIFAYPLFGWALVVPTIFTYGLLVLIPTLSLTHTDRSPMNTVIRYALALVIPLLFSIPMVGVLSMIHSIHPEWFPPFGFFDT